MVNGHLTKEVSCQQGIKQGCVLSPLLFILYTTEVGSFLENNLSGVKLQGVRISGLLYVDDLILIGRTPDDAKILLNQVQKIFEELGMAINCAKSNILCCRDAHLKLGTSLLSSEGNMLGDIKWAPKYKYLGVKVTTSSAAGIFVEATKTCKQKLRSHADSSSA